jgi:hypothetical protein
MIRVDLDGAIRLITSTSYNRSTAPAIATSPRCSCGSTVAPVDAGARASSRTATGQTISFAPQHFRRLEIEVTGSNGQPPARRHANAVGFAEAAWLMPDRLAGAGAEVVRMPSDLLAARGPRRSTTRSSC